MSDSIYENIGEIQGMLFCLKTKMINTNFDDNSVSVKTLKEIEKKFDDFSYLVLLENKK